ncbi:helix-turn-helix domain-containing protein [Ruania zhangjianzhongii]|uniref:helix-turn-helix domain-containing protein n=1 Tax=Ruania zhangjianzhongii TaxID=2603206 RepID=UPI0011C7B1C7|nr:helix-turn-helix domain-containing protein [Ruania zhangjianzhongii]
MTTNDQAQSVPELVAAAKGTLTAREVAAVLGVDRRTVYAAMDEGQIQYVEFGDRKLTPRRHVLDILMLNDVV